METDRLFVTILDGSDRDVILDLSSFQKVKVTFGRSEENDIVLNSPIVSKYHGWFEYAGGRWTIFDNHSTNGIFQNGEKLESKQLISGDKLLIGYESTSKKVTFVFSKNSPQNVYRKYNVFPGNEVVIGRAPECNIQLSCVSVFKQHCKIIGTNDGVYAVKVLQSAPVQYNGVDMPPRQKLSDMDQLLIGDTQFFYCNNTLSYIKIAEGLSFEVSHLSKIVGGWKEKRRINDDVTFSVNAGEMVAIIGGSGAGKSTLLNCLCGRSRISEGRVTIDGDDLTSNYSSLKSLIGYVPQQDIVYDDLTLKKMLYYTAKLRMPADSSTEEIEHRIDKALEYVELTERKDLLIRKLSGGQKKRASIAVELLSDPKLFFLDEPTSGLDPGTERNLMQMLKGMSEKGKTIVLVTHTPLNLSMCDKIVVMGRGGRLCFCGKTEDALAFFGVKSFVDIYNLINNDASNWAEYYKKKHSGPAQTQGIDNVSRGNGTGSKASALRQLGILIHRYAELQFNDIKRTVIQFLMAPGLGLLLFIAFKDSFPFQASGDTQKMALTLGCCAFWIGLFNTIQEICKECQIYERERMSNLKLVPYVGSKLIVNGIFDLVQSLLLLGTVGILIELPESGMQLKGLPGVELFITTYLTMLSATCMGLLASAVVNNSSQATMVAPVLLIPQILFSGIVVDLEGIINTISYIVSCRYACVAYCTTCNINNLPSEFKLTMLGYEAGETVIVSSVYSFGTVNSTIRNMFGEKFASVVSNPVSASWFLLAALSLVSLVFTVVVLKGKSKIQQ